MNPTSAWTLRGKAQNLRAKRLFPAQVTRNVVQIKL